MILKEPLARAKGHGSAKEGVMHWIAQRISSIALMPLLVWFTLSMIYKMDASYQDFVTFLSQPLTSVLMSLFVGTLFYHMWLGLRVVIEDYISSPFKRYTILIFLKFGLFFCTTLSIFAILKIALGAS